jgi:hypothetical protein
MRSPVDASVPPGARLCVARWRFRVVKPARVDAARSNAAIARIAGSNSDGAPTLSPLVTHGRR